MTLKSLTTSTIGYSSDIWGSYFSFEPSVI